MGERSLIAAIHAALERPPGSRVVRWIGDDCAVVRGDAFAAVSVDVMVDGTHFRLGQASPADIGHRALAAALSDLAAMGAQGREAYVQLGVREGISDAQLLDLADGLGGLAAAHRIAVAGGDVTRAPALLLAVTAIGHARGPEAVVRRSGARAGDLLAVTGALGGAAAGLVLLERPELGAGLEQPVAAALRRRQLEPEPLLAAGLALARAGATAMIDLSDGLGGDAGHLAAASSVAVRIEAERIPVQPGVAAVAEAAGMAAIDLAAAGGEDYELLATLPPERLAEASSAVAACGLELTVIGSVVTGVGVELSGASSAARPIPGFDQLRPRPPGRC